MLCTKVNIFTFAYMNRQDEATEAAHKLIRNGMKKIELARQLGISKPTLCYRLDTAGNGIKRAWRQLEIDKLHSLVAAIHER